MVEDREHSRTKCVHNFPHPLNRHHLYSHTNRLFDDTQEALLQLLQTLVHHGTFVKIHLVVGTSTVGPSYSFHGKEESPPGVDGMGHSLDVTLERDIKHRFLPHPYMCYGSILFGPSCEFPTIGVIQYVSPLIFT